MNRKICKLMPVLLLVSVLAAACGKGGTANSADSAGSDKAASEITVAVENASKPLSFTNEKGELDGYEVDVIKALDKEMPNYTIKIESVDSDAAEVGLDSDKYQFIGGGRYRTPEREKKYLFPDENTGMSVIRIYKRADDDSIQSLDDLVGKKVAPVTPNGGIYNLLIEYNEKHPDKKINFETSSGGTVAEKLQAVNEGKYDAFVNPANLGNKDVIKQLGLKVVEVEKPVQVNPTYFMLKKKDTKLKNDLDAAIKALKDRGELKKLSEKWYGEDIFALKPTANNEK